MHRIWVAAGLAASILLCGAGVPANDPPPSWAFVILQKSHDARPPTGLATLPGSKLRVTQEKLDDRFDVPDWFPEDHAKPPAVVLHGRAPALSACGYCHLPTGVGSPEDAVIAGLPEAYIEEQIDEFRSGRRQCAVPAVIPCGVSMNKIARAVNEDEMKQAATYYSRMPYRGRIRVVEASMAPKAEVNGFSLARVRSGGTEPIGVRILELADDQTRFEYGDWRTTITAYVPPGSIAHGKALVQSGAGAAPCASCHGERFQGLGTAPPLAGRSPSYLVRQLYDIQYGYRRGPTVAPMLPEVAHLRAEDRIAIAAYLAAERD
jgi:cytochrome c553